jgi:hypothetical protein
MHQAVLYMALDALYRDASLAMSRWRKGESAMKLFFTCAALAVAGAGGLGLIFPGHDGSRMIDHYCYSPEALVRNVNAHESSRKDKKSSSQVLDVVDCPEHQILAEDIQPFLPIIL